MTPFDLDAARPTVWLGPESDLGLPALVLAGAPLARPRDGERRVSFGDEAGLTFLELQLEWLVFQGVRRVVWCLGPDAEPIRRHFGDGAAFGAQLAYSVEERPLGTAGALALAQPLAAGPCLALNGDSFVDVDLGSLVRFHRAVRRRDPRCAGTLVLGGIPDARGVGAVGLDAAGRIARFAEFPARGRPAWLASAGLYLLEPPLLAAVEGGRPVSLEREVFPGARARGLQLYGFVTRSSFVDMGRGSERLELLFGGGT